MLFFVIAFICLLVYSRPFSILPQMVPTKVVDICCLLHHLHIDNEVDCIDLLGVIVTSISFTSCWVSHKAVGIIIIDINFEYWEIVHSYGIRIYGRWF